MGDSDNHAGPVAAIVSPDGESRLRHLLDAITDYAIYMLDCAGHVVFWNRGAEINTGYSNQELRGKHIQVFYTSEEVSAGRPLQDLAEAAKNGTASSEGWRLRKSGERRWVHCTLSAIRDSSGGLTGFSRVTQDVSERKRHEDAMHAMEITLREERDRLYGAAESSMDALYICESVRNEAGEIEDFVFTYLNRNVEKMVSLTRAELLGGRMCELLPVNREIGLFDRYKQVVLTGEPLAYEFPVNESSIKSSWLRVQAVKLKDGVAITASNIEAHKLQQDLANHDPLTGLPNRRLLIDRINQGIERAKRYGDRVGVFVVDLDSFKQINDTLGHAAGDEVLVTVAARLKSAVRGTDSVLRIGGDEFVIVMPDIGRESDIGFCGQKILETMHTIMNIQAHAAMVTCSVGVAVYPDTAETVDELLARADEAMFRAKRLGKNAVESYTPASQVKSALDYQL